MFGVGIRRQRSLVVDQFIILKIFDKSTGALWHLILILILLKTGPGVVLTFVAHIQKFLARVDKFELIL